MVIKEYLDLDEYVKVFMGKKLSNSLNSILLYDIPFFKLDDCIYLLGGYPESMFEEIFFRINHLDNDKVYCLKTKFLKKFIIKNINLINIYNYDKSANYSFWLKTSELDKLKY